MTLEFKISRGGAEKRKLSQRQVKPQRYSKVLGGRSIKEETGYSKERV